jgi:hypothetical protein
MELELGNLLGTISEFLEFVGSPAKRKLAR